jgi:hypothetical protein
MQYADRQWLTALGALTSGLTGAGGIPTHAAGPVAVGMILALLREELDRPV